MLFGDGDFYASADFYNQKLYMWEPILDRWHHIASVTEDGEIKYNVKSDHTIQMTVSGIMLETLMKTYSLLLSLTKEEDTAAARQITSEVFVQNKLGAPIAVDVIESATKNRIMSLNRSEKKDIVPVTGSMTVTSSVRPPSPPEYLPALTSALQELSLNNAQV